MLRTNAQHLSSLGPSCRPASSRNRLATKKVPIMVLNIPTPPPMLLLLPSLLFASSGIGSIGITSAFPENATTKINFHIPSSLRKDTDEGYQHRTSRFGTYMFRYVPHGSLALNVYLAEDDICSWPVNVSGGWPRRGQLPPGPAPGPAPPAPPGPPAPAPGPNNGTNNGTDPPTPTPAPAPPAPAPPAPGGGGGGMTPWKSPFVLMTTRSSSCTFVTQTRHAQMSGAAALLIADDTCLCSNENCTKSASPDDPPCQVAEPTVADDGSGSDVSIPAFLLHKVDGDAIKATLQKNTPVLVDVRWHPPKMVNFVNYTMWMDILDDYTKVLLEQIKPIVLALGDKARLSSGGPRHLIHNGTSSHCQGNAGPGQDCDKVCTNNGRYCYPSYAKISGYKVVTEALRRMCIWKHHGQDADEGNDDPNKDKDVATGQPWWDYVTYFNEFCSTTNETFDDDKCVADAYGAAGVSVEDIKECMTDSGDVTADVPNTLLDQLLKDTVENGIVVAPTVRVNHQTLGYPSGPTAWGLMEAVCGGFSDGGTGTPASPDFVPELCKQCKESDDVVECAKKFGPAPTPPSGGGGGAGKKGHFWRNTFLFLMLAGAGAFVYYKKFRDEGAAGRDLGGLRYAMLGDQE